MFIMIIRNSASKEIYKNKIWYSVFKPHNSMVSSEGARLFMTLYEVQGKRIDSISSPERAKL